MEPASDAWQPPEFLPDGIWLYKKDIPEDAWYVSRNEPGPRAYPPDCYIHKGSETPSPPIKLAHLAALSGVRFSAIKLPPVNKVQIKRL